MRLGLAVMVSVALLHAEGPDLRRNARIQRKAAVAARAQADYAAEMKVWQSECDAKGLELQPIAANLMDCMPKRLNPQQQEMMRRGPTAAPPATPAPKPEEKK